jgi:hypothetical protein
MFDQTDYLGDLQLVSKGPLDVVDESMARAFLEKPGAIRWLVDYHRKRRQRSLLICSVIYLIVNGGIVLFQHLETSSNSPLFVSGANHPWTLCWLIASFILFLSVGSWIDGGETAASKLLIKSRSADAVEWMISKLPDSCFILRGQRLRYDPVMYALRETLLLSPAKIEVPAHAFNKVRSLAGKIKSSWRTAPCEFLELCALVQEKVVLETKLSSIEIKRD